MPVNARLEAPPSSEAWAQVDRILQSRTFRNAEVLRHLLGYLAEKSLDGTRDDVTEHIIGVEALGKAETYDPRQDATVRMHIARMRQKLGDYYRLEGVSDPIAAEIPKGRFRITFEYRMPAPSPAPSPTLEVNNRRPRREIVLLYSLVLAACCAIFFIIEFWRAERLDRVSSGEPAALTPALRELWGPLLAPDRRLVVCVGTPLFVNVPGFGVVHEPSTIDWGDVSDSRGLAALEAAARGGVREPSYAYTEVGTATGAFLLGQFLAPRKKDVRITRANLMSWPEIAADNVIFLGSSAGIRQADDIPMDAQFVLDQTGVENLTPHKGEPAFLHDHPPDRSGGANQTYALISRVPAMNGPGAILMLFGNQTPSVVGGVQAFTNPSLAQALVSHLHNASGAVPRYFQVVLSIKAMDDVPVQIDYVLSRELPDRTQHLVEKKR